MVRLLLACALALGLAGGAHALTPEQARAIAAGDSTDARIAALNQAVQTADARTAAFVDALANDAVKLAGGQVLVVDGERAHDPVTGAAAALPADAEDVVNNNLMRAALGAAQAALQLGSAEEPVRLAAALFIRFEPHQTRSPFRIEQRAQPQSAAKGEPQYAQPPRK